ncbi:MAG: homocysteine S-methyltransferase family protein [Candidatus Aminicenantes bacterium]|nr:MAG: homocysteine S-methyltransferase family protein [Candidatus Aminicenantes bacterium]
MESILDRIKKGEILIADGAMGSLLMARAKDLIKGKCPEVINLSRADILEEVARLYLEAGADIVQTNTFGGSPLKLSDYHLEDKTGEINRVAVEAVKKAVKEKGGKAYVSASCGPSGKMLKPYGNIEAETMAENFTRQLSVVIEAGVDIVNLETMTDVQEAVLAVKAAKEISPSIPVMANMTFNKTPRGFFTVMGVNIEKAAKELEAAGADIIGSNCGNGIENMIEIAKEYKKYSHLPLIIQANAGLPEIKDDVVVYPETPEFMAEKSKELAAAGVLIIGGCCGTTPDHIRAISQAVKNIKTIKQ